VPSSKGLGIMLMLLVYEEREMEPNTYPQSQTTSPAGNALAITPDDGTDLTEYNRELYIGGAGDLTVIMAANGEQVTFTSIAGGTRLPYVVSRVLATGTTATNIVALW